MRLKISHRQQERAGLALVLLFSPFLALVALAIAILVITGWCKRKLIGPHANWTRWLAWHPVNLGEWYEPDWRWLEIVERKSSILLADIEYRAQQGEECSNAEQ